MTERTSHGRSVACLAALCILAAFAAAPAGCSRKSAHVADEAVQSINDLNDPAPEIRIRAAERLGALREKSAVRPLARRLNDIRSDVRRTVVRSLGLIGDRAATGPLCGVLTSTDADSELRRMAAESLGLLADPAAIPALAQLLGDKDAEVSFAGAYALARIGEPAFDTLLRTAEGGELGAQRAAANVLGQVPGERTGRVLLALLSNPDASLRLSAAENLAQLQYTNAAPEIVALLTDPDETVRRGTPRVLVSLGTAVARPLCGVLRMVETQSVVRATGKKQTSGVPVASAQEAAVDVLMKLEGPETVPPLVAATRLGDSRLAGPAHARLMEHLGEPSYREAFFGVIFEGLPAEQEGALGILGGLLRHDQQPRKRRNDRRSPQPDAGIRNLVVQHADSLARVMETNHPGIRIEAALCLCIVGDARGKDIVLAELRNTIAQLRAVFTETKETANAGETKGKTERNEERDRKTLMNLALKIKGYLRALYPFADRALADEVSPLLSLKETGKDQLVTSEIAYGLVPILEKLKDARDFDILVGVLQHKTGPSGDSPGGLACRALGAIGDKRGFDAIVAKLNALPNDDFYSDFRVTAYRALFLCDKDRAYDYTAKLLVAYKPHVMKPIEGICRLYAEFPDKKAVWPLAHWVNHDLRTTREVVHEALVAVAQGNPAVLIEAFEVDNHQKRSAVAGLLADAFGAKALPALQQAVADPRPRTRQGAIWAFGCIGGPEAVAAVRAALADPHAAVRSAAAWSVGRMKDTALAVSLVPLLKDPDDDVRSMAAEQLGLFAESRAVDPLIAALSDTNSAVRGYAALSLGKMHATNALPALRELAKDPHPDVRTAADSALHTLAGL